MSPLNYDPRERQIPAIDASFNGENYHQQPVDLGHARSHERLVELSSLGFHGENVYARNDGLNPPYFKAFPGAVSGLWCRESVAERLKQVNDSLAPLNVELFVLDAFRPIEVQVAIFNFFMEFAQSTLDDPTPEACREFVAQYAADPTNYNERDSTTWPQHLTGGAIDLTLKRKGSGELLYMGGVFDDPSEISHTDYYENLNGCFSTSCSEAQRNRRLLFWSMVEAGFSNWPHEFWHYDYGDQQWSMFRRALGFERQTSWFGPTQLPEASLAR